MRACLIDGRVGLGHRRLSIVDLGGGPPADVERGRQASGSCFNGEIYNHRDLRPGLEARGPRIPNARATQRRSSTFTRSGDRALVEELRGHVRLRDLGRERSNRLLLARDRLGIKPLYYTLTDDGVSTSRQRSKRSSKRGP